MANDVVDLEALKDLRAIDGKSSFGISLSIVNNANLASLAGLRNVRGALPGALDVTRNGALTSLSTTSIGVCSGSATPHISNSAR